MIQKKILEKKIENMETTKKSILSNLEKVKKRLEELKGELSNLDTIEIFNNLNHNGTGHIAIKYGTLIDVFRTFGRPEIVGTSVMIRIRERIRINATQRGTFIEHTFVDELSDESSSRIYIEPDDQYKIIDAETFSKYEGAALSVRSILKCDLGFSDLQPNFPEEKPEHPRQLRWTKNANWEEYIFEDERSHVAGSVRWDQRSEQWVAGIATVLTVFKDIESDWKESPGKYKDFNDARVWVEINATQTCQDEPIYQNDGLYFVSSNI